MAARALDNHHTPPPFSPAKRGTLMSLLQDQELQQPAGTQTSLQSSNTITHTVHKLNLLTACQCSQQQRCVNTKWQKAWIRLTEIDCVSCSTINKI